MSDTFVSICDVCEEEWMTEINYNLVDEYVCPHCSMPVWQMIRDIYREEGLKGVILQVIKRCF